MKRIKIIVGAIIICNLILAQSQENCCHEDIILSFLNKISSTNYKPILQDYRIFFDNHSEIEFSFRDKILKNSPGSELSDMPESKSYTIETVLNNETVKYLINLRSIKNCKWKIFKQYKKGSATIIFEVGVDCSSKLIKIQMVNWAYKKRCGICDILDINDKTIF